MAAHQKHPPLARRRLGHYAPTEFALLGTTCTRIDGLLERWSATLKERFRVLTVTGEHADPHSYRLIQEGSKQFRGPATGWNDYDDRLLGQTYDLALVNGNHFPAARQIVFVDPQKAGTLERRRDQLTDVVAVVRCPGAESLPAWLATSAPVFDWSEQLPEVLGIIISAGKAARPPLRAVILAGGQSTRMGTDKAGLVYRGQRTEAQRLTDACRNLGLETYLSVATPQDEPAADATQLPDRFPGLGPMGAICTAFLHEPDVAWLVLACDLPLLGGNTLERLLAARDSRKYATAPRDPARPFPEPLVAIYEPRAYGRLLQLLGLGYACPRKLLINSDIAELQLPDAKPLTNANDQADRAEILSKMA